MRNANNQYLIEEFKEVPSNRLSADEATEDTIRVEKDPRKTSSSSLDKPEVNNVENIYKRVFGNFLFFMLLEEFSNFKENFESKAPK